MTPIKKLKDKLTELFQLDQADLDFGIYRIMNAKRKDIVKFLDDDLLPQVEEAFAHYKSADKVTIKEKLEKAISQARSLDVNPDKVAKVIELRAQYSTSAIDVAELQNEVFSHLYSFFSRYYDNGDFISQRRYKEGVYAIPYEGEEVKLHWANHDQYYIKTAENFRDYSFKLPVGKGVQFKITEADTEKDNVKATEDKDRRFIYTGVITEDAELFVANFEYRADEEKRRQVVLTNLAATAIIEDLQKLATPAALTAIKQLTTTWHRANGEPSERTVLGKHLYEYTKRNTFDYFIHKNLGKFLRRELDFYIKNEVMHLDDIEHETAPKVEQYLSKIKVIRAIAHKIIQFLAQLEDFQKKLWLKKKFVVETNYCITLDRVAEELYPEIAANEAQRKEWIRLYAIDEITAEGVEESPGQSEGKQKELFPTSFKVKYSAPLTVEFLKANPYLMLDTKFFNDNFKSRLIATIDDFDEQCDGVLMHSENFQALGLMQDRYKEQVKCIYIDPPYNTDASPIIYKNSFRNSSWASLIENRLSLAQAICADDGILCVTIDDFESKNLEFVVEYTWGRDNVLGVVAIRNNPSGRPTPLGFAISHEYAIFVSKNKGTPVKPLPRSDRLNKRYKENDNKGRFMWELLRKRGSDSEQADSPKAYYPFYISKTGKIRLPHMTWNDNEKQWNIHEAALPNELVAYPIDDEGIKRRWRWGLERAQQEISEIKADIKQTAVTMYYKYRPPTGVTPTTNWIDSRYSATEHGTGLLKKYFQEYDPFSFPKSVFAVKDCLRVAGITKKCVTLDFFAGSGSTGHAVINLNRKDQGERKYILVEMGDHFDTVLKPRIQKVVYASDWKDGKPVKRDTGISHMFKYIRLESYEDALANIQMERSSVQELALESSTEFRESYTLSYMLDVESRGSASLLNLNRFNDPFAYKLLVGTGSVGETKPTDVDLVETFNWLLGLKVKHIDTHFGKDSEKPTFKVVEGTNPRGEKVLVIWRRIKELDSDDENDKEVLAKANKQLDEFFKKRQYNTLDMEFDLIYVNGDNNLMNLPMAPDETGQEPGYKVRLIEEEFKRLMFDVQDV